MKVTSDIETLFEEFKKELAESNCFKISKSGEETLKEVKKCISKAVRNNIQYLQYYDKLHKLRDELQDFVINKKKNDGMGEIEYKESTKVFDVLDTALIRFRILLKNIE